MHFIKIGIEVSLELKKIRLETKENSPRLEVIKQESIDTEFTLLK